MTRPFSSYTQFSCDYCGHFSGDHAQRPGDGDRAACKKCDCEDFQSEAADRAEPASTERERQFQAQVVESARSFGWHVHGGRPAQYRLDLDALERRWLSDPDPWPMDVDPEGITVIKAAARDIKSLVQRLREAEAARQNLEDWMVESADFAPALSGAIDRALRGTLTGMKARIALLERVREAARQVLDFGIDPTAWDGEAEKASNDLRDALAALEEK